MPFRQTAQRIVQVIHSKTQSQATESDLSLCILNSRPNSKAHLQTVLLTQSKSHNPDRVNQMSRSTDSGYILYNIHIHTHPFL